MAEFRSRANQGIITVAGDDEDILLCPNCFFPNSGTARECVACNYTLQNGNVRWLRAGFIRPCSNPNCTDFVFSRDTQCPKCGHPIGNSNQAPSAEDTNAPTSAEMPRDVLICPECHAENPLNASQCSMCDAPLHNTATAKSGAMVLNFHNLRTERVVQLSLPANGTIMIGREGLLSGQFPADGSQSNVSRVHMSLLQRDGRVYIRDERSTNGTYVNYREVTPGRELPIESGSVIELGPNARENRYSEYFELTY